MPTNRKSGPRSTRSTESAEGASNPFDAFAMQPNGEIPALFREFAENGIAQLRDGYAKMKTAAEEATDVLEDTFETARGGALAFGVKAIDTAKANTDASFAFARDLFGAKTVAELIELQSSFARKQFDAATVQLREFQELAQKIATDAAKPATGHIEKTFNAFRSA